MIPGKSLTLIYLQKMSGHLQSQCFGVSGGVDSCLPLAGPRLR